MIRTVLFIVFLIAGSVQAQTDTTSTVAEPSGGIERLAWVFYTIEFTSEQRQSLAGRPLEFFFYVDHTGEAKLESTNGTDDQAIIDSLMTAGQVLPPFTPATKGGMAVPSLYMMKLTFPSYQPSSSSFYTTTVHPYIGKYRLSDFDTLAVDHPSIHILFGGFANGFTGPAGNFLGPGGGFKVEMVFFDSNLMYYGMNMAFSGNERKRDYRISDEREQEGFPPTLFLGITAGKKLRDFLIQVDADLALQNIITIDSNSEREPVQFWGFSPALVINYPIGIGSRVVVNHFGSVRFDHYLNVHTGYRHLFMDNSQAKGGMWELGLSWRFANSPVRHYRFREGVGGGD